MRFAHFLFLLLAFETATLGAVAAGIDWRHDIAAAALEAKSANKYLFVEIGAPWCGPCRNLEKLAKNKALGEWVSARFISVHLEADDPGGKAILRKFGMNGIPALIVFDANGNFKNKQSGAAGDVEGLKQTLTQLAGGEDAFANAGGNAAGFNSGFSQQNGGFNSGTASGAYAQPENFQQPQQGYQQFQQQQPIQPQYQQPAQYYQQPQQGFQQPQQGYPQQVAPPARYSQPYPQPVMQWQGQNPAPQQWQSQPAAPQQWQSYPQMPPSSQGQYPPQGQYPQPGQYPQQTPYPSQQPFPQQGQYPQQAQYQAQGQNQIPNQAMPTQMQPGQMSPNQYAPPYPQSPNQPQK
ncbi:MAG: hypothetical protein C0507_08535 [Cyanobacteria bacterium PR.3.49]|nr:hypothetical protein [Cyanobacteria bacterium PR.3.49]